MTTISIVSDSRYPQATIYITGVFLTQDLSLSGDRLQTFRLMGKEVYCVSAGVAKGQTTGLESYRMRPDTYSAVAVVSQGSQAAVDTHSSSSLSVLSLNQ